jgi:membrane protease subunit HflK
VRDAAQAAMREAVGRMTVDGVLRERKEALTSDVAVLLQDILDSYDAGIDVEEVQLQDVQPPAAVRAAFDDVVAATQDASRVMNEAEGYRNEVLPDARRRPRATAPRSSPMPPAKRPASRPSPPSTARRRRSRRSGSTSRPWKPCCRRSRR